MLELVIGQIPEAIYFSLFMIYAKKIKEKRIIYVILMTFEYILLAQCIKYNVWLQILYTFISFLILKILYKQKAQVTDIFTFTIASIFLIISSTVMYYIVYFTFHNMVGYVILNRIVIFMLLFIFKNKLNKIQLLYKKMWNRNDNIKKKMKSTTFRALNIVIFNIIFYVINIGMLLSKIMH